MLATTAMHAYGHQWTCQLVYNPRLCPGMGLTDGEGVERLWSHLRQLIGITRSSGVSTPCISTFQFTWNLTEITEDLADRPSS